MKSEIGASSSSFQCPMGHCCEVLWQMAEEMSLDYWWSHKVRQGYPSYSSRKSKYGDALCLFFQIVFFQKNQCSFGCGCSQYWGLIKRDWRRVDSVRASLKSHLCRLPKVHTPSKGLGSLWFVLLSPRPATLRQHLICSCLIIASAYFPSLAHFSDF